MLRLPFKVYGAVCFLKYDEFFKKIFKKFEIVLEIIPHLPYQVQIDKFRYTYVTVIITSLIEPIWKDS